jgi:D-arabinose 1-dehydrogenase-like Zn-dependent alcohol dehydrogenase
VAAPSEPLTINVLPMIGARQSLHAWPSGTAKDSEDTLAFSGRTGVRPVIERFPLEKAADAYQLMLTGKARFRAVLMMQ